MHLVVDTLTLNRKKRGPVSAKLLPLERYVPRNGPDRLHLTLPIVCHGKDRIVTQQRPQRLQQGRHHQALLVEQHRCRVISLTRDQVLEVGLITRQVAFVGAVHTNECQYCTVALFANLGGGRRLSAQAKRRGFKQRLRPRYNLP